MRLTELKEGQRGIISSFNGEEITVKFLALGVLPGSEVEVVRIAPFKGGYYIKVDGSKLALRVEEAVNIMLH